MASKTHERVRSKVKEFISTTDGYFSIPEMANSLNESLSALRVVLPELTQEGVIDRKRIPACRGDRMVSLFVYFNPDIDPPVIETPRVKDRYHLPKAVRPLYKLLQSADKPLSTPEMAQMLGVPETAIGGALHTIGKQCKIHRFKVRYENKTRYAYGVKEFEESFYLEGVQEEILRVLGSTTESTVTLKRLTTILGVKERWVTLALKELYERGKIARVRAGGHYTKLSFAYFLPTSPFATLNIKHLREYRIMHALHEANRGMTLSSISTRLNTTPSNIHKVLQSLYDDFMLDKSDGHKRLSDGSTGIEYRITEKGYRDAIHSMDYYMDLVMYQGRRCMG